MTPIGPKNVRNQLITFRPASPEQKAAITTAASDAGMSSAGWVRDLLLARAGYQDVTRRRATRKPNETPRQEETGNAPIVARVSQREKAAIERRAARAKKDVSDWARVVIAKELDKEQQR
jgi:uncharacterized protein (DUF1778 family)